MRYLFRLYNEFAVDPESDLAEEVGANLAHAIQATGAEMIYFDDSEAVPDPYAGHISRYHAILWKAIGMPYLQVQASQHRRLRANAPRTRRPAGYHYI